MGALKLKLLLTEIVKILPKMGASNYLLVSKPIREFTGIDKVEFKKISYFKGEAKDKFLCAIFIYEEK